MFAIIILKFKYVNGYYLSMKTDLYLLTAYDVTYYLNKLNVFPVESPLKRIYN